MMRRAAPGVVLAALLVVNSCSRDDKLVQVVGGHKFRVPAHNLIAGVIPWLPRDPEQNFTYTINPNAPIREQVTVLVKNGTDYCSASRRAEEQRRQLATCGVMPIIDVSVDHDSELIKIAEVGYTTQWRYYSKSGRPVASCSAMEFERHQSGACSAILSYKSLACTINFGESEIVNLMRIKKQIRNQLELWEI